MSLTLGLNFPQRESGRERGGEKERERERGREGEGGVERVSLHYTVHSEYDFVFVKKKVV